MKLLAANKIMLAGFSAVGLVLVLGNAHLGATSESVYSPYLLGTPVLIESKAPTLKGRIILTQMREWETQEPVNSPPVRPGDALQRTMKAFKEWELYCLVELEDGSYSWYKVTVLKVDKARREKELEKVQTGNGD
jgi:hypothetical protein